MTDQEDVNGRDNPPTADEIYRRARQRAADAMSPYDVESGLRELSAWVTEHNAAVDQASERVFESGQRLRTHGIHGLPGLVTVDFASKRDDGSWTVFVKTDDGGLQRLDVPADGTSPVEIIFPDGSGDSRRVLAGMWTQWMAAASHNAKTSILAASPLRPYAHQANAVYGAMLPQPRMRFLLGDEPGTGKTIMAGMYLREMQRLELIRKALIVAPANIVTKWIDDFERFFGGGLRRITADTVREHALDVEHDMWIVSLELAATNGNVQDAIRPDKIGWDVVVFDEAHRLTPTASTFHRVGRLLAKPVPRALLMTATPHRGSEWLFRHLLHFVDPDVYPDPGMDRPKDESQLARLKPSAIHFLRRMKESLVDYDGETRLFHGRTAHNQSIRLNTIEAALYERALAMVDEFFPPSAQPLARMVYGKRAASTLYALKETLLRRRDKMGLNTPITPSGGEDPFDDEDSADSDERQVINSDSVSARREKAAIDDLVADIDNAFSHMYLPSKWRRFVTVCLQGNGIEPGNDEQAVVFTEYTDSAVWIADRLRDEGYTAQVYSGRKSPVERDKIRAAFMRGEYQIIVSTDAGNEGIDLQSAHVLVNYDIPWSLVRLEQRMGRIHRIGQTRNVELYNLIATDTREGETLEVLLGRFVNAANELDGQLFDSLSLVAELAKVNYDEWLRAVYGSDEQAKQQALEAARRVTTADLKNRVAEVRERDKELASAVEARAALTLLQDDLLERVNPAIVRAFLERLHQADVLSIAPAPQGEGILRLTRPEGLPRSLTGPGNSREAVVATSGDALAEAKKDSDTSGVVTLGPGEPAFADLITLAVTEFDPDLYQGGAASDSTSITGYDLYAFTATFIEAGGKKSTQWVTLIRVDATGDADATPWETLANLTPIDQPAPPEDPVVRNRAIQAAAKTARDSEFDMRKVRTDWFQQARTELINLPFTLTRGISDPAEKSKQYQLLTKRRKERLTELEVLTQFRVSDPKLVGHVTVFGGAEPPTAEEKNSEDIATRLVVKLLAARNWKVDDVHLKKRGYDLIARRGSELRMIEVKGIWGKASSAGISMTGNEVLMATQHASDFWLYVIDECQSGGRMFAAYRDPLSKFRSDIAGAATIRIPGSALLNAQNDEGPAQ